MRRFGRLTGMAAAAAVVLSLLTATLAWADNALADGDNAVPLSTHALAFGNVCANSTVTKDVLVGVSRTGGSSGFRNSTSAMVSVVGSAGTGVSAAMAAPQPAGSSNPFTIPSTFEGSGSGTLAGQATGRVTLVAGATTGNRTGTVTFRVTGTKASNGSALTEDTVLSLSATVVACDTTPPTLNLPANITAEATGPTGRVVTFTATATDVAPASPAVSCAPTSGSTFPLGTTTATCTSTDAAGNVATGSFTITIRDTTPPALSAPANLQLEATSAAGATVTFTSPTATDLVDGSRPVTCTPASGAVLPLGVNTVTCGASDTRGNAASTSFRVTVADTTDPSLIVPGPITREATGPSGASATYAASASDTVSGSITPACAPASGSTFALGTTTVSCTATDVAGNDTSATFPVTVVDTTAPVVSVPTSFSAEASGSGGATITFASSANDLVDGPLATVCTAPSGSTFPLGTTAVTCTATDAASNTGSAAFEITVVDTTPPVLHLPADVIVEADGPTGKVLSFTATATDVVDGTVSVSCTPGSGSAFSVGVHTVTCAAADVRGNDVTAELTITVTDTTEPMVMVPEDITAEATGSDGAVVDFSATASDIVDGDVTPSCTPGPGSTFTLGTTEVECSAIDVAGNTGSGSFEVTVVDTTPPVISDVSSNLTVEAVGPDGAIVTYDDPTATDLVDGIVTVTCSPASGATFPLDETTTVTCTATDEADNSSTATFDVLVSDNTAPSLALPGDQTAEATGPGGATVAWTASASDLVDGDVAVTCDPPSGEVFALGSTPVGCWATDSHANTSSGDFTVTVVDTTPPVLTLPDPMTVEATGSDGATVSFVPTSSDLVDGAVPVSCSPASGTVFGLGTTSVDCSATDAAGNTAPGSFMVTVVDTTAPDLSVPADITAEATGPLGAAVSFTATAYDLVSGDLLPSCTPAPGVFPLATTTVECSVTDGAGNTATAAFSVTVEDTTDPALNVPADIGVEATGPAGATVSYTATATDIVAGTLTPTCAPTSGSTFAIGSTTVSCTVVDGYGNTSTGTFVVSVVDTTAPTIVGTPTDLEREAAGPDGAVVTYTNPTATDLVDGAVIVTCEPPSGSTFPLDVPTAVTCTATDAHGNPGSSTFTVLVEDSTAPTLALPVAAAAEATGPTGATVSFTTSATDLVDGVVPVLCVPPSGSTFPLGATAVACSAADVHGNGSNGGFSVTVVDTTPPTVIVPADIAVEATGPTGAVVSYSASANDLVDGALTPTCSLPSGGTFAIGTATVTCSATDAHTNTGSATFTVTVRDTTAPALTVPGPLTRTATGATGAAVGFTVTALDVVDGSVSVACTPPPGSTFAAGLHNVTCTATDARANTGSGGFSVTVLFDLSGGFLSPVNPSALNTVKGGSTVPLKWTVRTPSGADISALSIISGFALTEVRCASVSTVLDPVDFTTTGGTTLRYAGNQFIQNWQTPRRPGACVRVDVVFAGGLQRLSALFQLK